MARDRRHVGARLLTVALMGLGVGAVVAGAGPHAGAASQAWQSRALPWTISGPVQGSVTGVSCISATVCVAAGSALLPGATTNTGAFVATLKGANWTQGLLPLPSGAVGAELSGVSCTSDGSCVAAGSYGVLLAGTTVAHALVEKFDGHVWTPLVGLDPSGSSSASLSGVSCPAVASCTASGTAQISPGTGPHAFVTRLAKGVWSDSLLPLPKGVTSDSLTAVSCVGPTSCAAVGTTNLGVALLEVGSTSTWKGTLASAVTGSSLASVSCAGVGSCVAVGTHGTGWAERLSGKTWTADTVLPSTAPLTSLSCTPDSSVCTAWGPGPVIETLSAGTWSLISTPGLTPTSQPVAGSCSSATVCVAVEATGLNAPHAVAVLTGSGAIWTSSFLPGPAYAGLDQVSCSSVRCVGVGRYYDASATQYAVVVELSAGHWVPVTYPLPTFYLFHPSVSCTARTCVVVSGQSAAVSTTERTWTVQSLPTPTGFTGYLDADAVSCPSAGTCVAVGTTLGAGNGLFAESLAGGIWSATLLPSTLGNGTLGGVSCVSAVSCTAVGTGGTGGIQALVERLAGATWSEDVLPPATGATFGQLNDVSCTTTTECVAVGAWFPSFGGSGSPLAAVLSGGTWTQTRVTAPVTAFGFSSVSCPSTGTCDAIYSGQAMQLAGGSWSPVAIPLPTGATDLSLSSVRCVLGSWCVIAGQAGGAAAGTGETQSVPMISTLSAPVPSITSAPTATATVGVPASVTLRAVSNPKASVSVEGSLPAGFTVVAHANGTATLAGTATAGEVGSYHLTVVADNGLVVPVSQAFTVTIA
jgi:hypothetical protein